jgi:NADH:ubiquinone oxidoreductase subunit 5 (subunit L)/multisubunit Na+/H+ antiporter MnhA subunit
LYTIVVRYSIKTNQGAESGTARFSAVMPALAGLMLAGLPGTAGYLAKAPVAFRLLSLTEHHSIYSIPLVLMAGVIFFSAYAVFRLIQVLFFREAGGDAPQKISSLSPAKSIVLIILLLCSIAFLYTIPYYNPLTIDRGWIQTVFSGIPYYDMAALGEYPPFAGELRLHLYVMAGILLLITGGAYSGFRFAKTSINVPKRFVSILENEFYVDRLLGGAVPSLLRYTNKTAGRFELWLISVIQTGAGYMVNTISLLTAFLERAVFLRIASGVHLSCTAVSKRIKSFYDVEFQTQVTIIVAGIIVLVTFLLAVR